MGAKITKFGGPFPNTSGMEGSFMSPGKFRSPINNGENKTLNNQKIPYNTPMISKKPFSPPPSRGKTKFETFDRQGPRIKSPLQATGIGEKLHSPKDYSSRADGNRTYTKKDKRDNIQRGHETFQEPSSYQIDGQTENAQSNFNNSKIKNNAKVNMVKMGTVLEKKKPKFSIVNNLRRNTNLENMDTQQVIDNI